MHLRPHRPARPPLLRAAVAAGIAACAASLAGLPAWAADIDIYRGNASTGAPNVLLFLDNTSNWSAQNQSWTPQSSWARCVDLAPGPRAACQDAISQVFYVGTPHANEPRPWQPGFSDWNNSKAPTQGQVEVRALRLVLRALVCDAPEEQALNVNLGLSMFSPDKGTAASTGHASAFIYHAVRPLTKGANCNALIQKLTDIDVKIQDPQFKAPSDADYGAALFEAFKYFGGFTNPALAASSPGTPGSPISATGYGPRRYSSLTPLDDPLAFTGADRLTYMSPISADGSCGNNYLVLVGNTYPNAEPNNASTLRFQGIGYTPPPLSPITSDTNRFADEWTAFLANTDVNLAPGIQRVFTYAVNVYNDSPSSSQTRLLRSMASVGGIGSDAYIEVGGDLYGLIEAFKRILFQVAAVNSVFTATTLPVSTTTQGTFLNQIFVGMFRPGDNPRWVGNLKQYQMSFVNGVLDLVDAKGNAAVLGSSGFFSPLAESFWTQDSVFFTNRPSGTPPTGSDLPDGAIVEKGGAAQMLREAILDGAGGRRVFTLPAGTPAGAALSSYEFRMATPAVSAVLNAEEVAWARGEANVPVGVVGSSEEFQGSKPSGTSIVSLGTTGARHSVHGDVLHSRPVALNYGLGGVVVYYGSNDGFFRAVGGNKTGTNAGQELWSFVSPEHFPLLKRQRSGSPALFLPETNEAGATLAPPSDRAPKGYGMDGPIGVFALYNTGGQSVKEAFIYPTMRRGGRSVYAFDVSTSTNPRFMWKITGGSGDYSKLAQTWSTPKPIAFPSTTTPAPVVLFMGGGYDPAEDQDRITGADGIGNVVYVINGRTGARVAALPTSYSVPGDVVVVDVKGDGVPDRAYFADVRGNLYRIDLPPPADILDSAKWTDANRAVKIAELGGKMFFAPDVVVTSQFVAVLVGSGDREKPLMISTSDNFFMVKDTLGAARETPLVKADLTRVARIDNATMQPVDVVSPVNDPEGCYIELATNGEKVVNAPFSIAGTTYFGTNRPTPAGAASCTADLGEAHAYAFPLFCTAPRVTRLVGGGLPPSPVGGIVEIDTGDGKPILVPFIIGGGAGGSAFKPERATPAISPVRTRLNWHINNANR
jgi:type IV pilus assembly protein PilY1